MGGYSPPCLPSSAPLESYTLYSKVKFTYSSKPRYVILHIANHDIVMVCVITYFNYITTHTFPLGSEKGMSYYIFTMVCPNTEYVLLSILILAQLLLSLTYSLEASNPLSPSI